jgi:hypothetical protein
MAQDYLLRLIEQVSQMIAEILALRKVGRISDAAEQIEAMCRQNVGLPFDLVISAGNDSATTGERWWHAACSRGDVG